MHLYSRSRAFEAMQSGVSQIRHSHSLGEAFDVVKPSSKDPPRPSDPIVPSYSIDMEAQSASNGPANPASCAPESK